jgi:hypothetical protein
MHKHLSLIIALAALASPVFGQEIAAKVFNPTDVYPPSYSPEFAGKPVIYDFVKPLILQLQEPKDNDFISAGGAKATLNWRLQIFIIVSGDVVAANFTEGHIEVIGIFVRNTAKKQWELSTEVGGRFKVHVYDEQTGKPKEGEQAGTGQPATRPESKSEGSDKPQPESEGRSR